MNRTDRIEQHGQVIMIATNSTSRHECIFQSKISRPAHDDGVVTMILSWGPWGRWCQGIKHIRFKSRGFIVWFNGVDWNQCEAQAGCYSVRLGQQNVTTSARPEATLCVNICIKLNEMKCSYLSTPSSGCCRRYLVGRNSVVQISPQAAEGWLR